MLKERNKILVRLTLERECVTYASDGVMQFWRQVHLCERNRKATKGQGQ